MPNREVEDRKHHSTEQGDSGFVSMFLHIPIPKAGRKPFNHHGHAIYVSHMKYDGYKSGPFTMQCDGSMFYAVHLKQDGEGIYVSNIGKYPQE